MRKPQSVNLTVCLRHRQELKSGPCYGACPCPLTGRDVIDHAAAGDCPEARFAGPKFADVASLPATITATVPIPSKTFGPGDLLKAVIGAVGFKPQKNCRCEAKRREVNSWGWWVAWKRRGEIVDWLCIQAKDAGVTVPTATVAGLLRVALRTAWQRRRRKDAKSIPQDTPTS